MEERISIIVRCWNTEKTLRRCLDSLINQTYANIEIVIVDDGSTDTTLSIIADYSTKYNDKIRVVLQEHKGAFYALKNGVENANGDWIGFVDSDDRIDEKMLEEMLKKAKQFNADCVQCENYFLNEDQSLTENQRVKDILVFDSFQAMKNFVNGTSIVRSGLCYKIYKRELFEKLEWIPSYLAEDTALMYQIYDKAKVVVCLPNMFYHTCRLENSLTRSKFVAKKYDLHDVYDRMKTFFRTKGKYKELVPYALNSQIGAIYYSAGEMMKAKLDKVERKKLRERIKRDIKKFCARKMCL